MTERPDPDKATTTIGKSESQYPRVTAACSGLGIQALAMQSVEAGWARSSDNSSDDLSLSHSLDVHVQLTPRPMRRLRGRRSRRELHMCLVDSARGTKNVISSLVGLYAAARDGSMRGASRMGSERVVRATCMHVSRLEGTGVGASHAQA